ncbi:hypothetical protein T07_4128 [Trichinella nelsoni]|uniref:Uncharacterized protein n=1 Tax=Trichinella nelsoni TaxID=6336 RepID=A0A0V0RQU3_9BILA|nr:hypothetical protein T07_4128 [Trichinella nelsoni]
MADDKRKATGNVPIVYLRTIYCEHAHFNGSSTARYKLAVTRLEELHIQYFNSKTARREKRKEENAFR